MWDLAVREEDYQAVDAMLARYRGRSPLSLRLLPATQRSPTGAVDSLLDEGRSLESRQLQIAARYAASYLRNFGLADSLARLDLEWRSRPANRAGAQLLLAGLAASRGRWNAARDAFRVAQTMEGAGDVIVHLAFAATLPHQPVSERDLSAIRDAVVAWDPSRTAGGSSLSTALRTHLRQYLLGLLASRSGDGLAAERAAASIEALPTPPSGRAVAQSLAAIVRADVAASQDRPRDVLRALERVDYRIPLELIAVSRAVHMSEFGLEHGRYLRGAALSALGQNADALTWFRFGLRGSPQEYLYHAPIHLRLGEVFEKMSQPDSAAFHYGRVLELWSQADSGAARLLEDVRRRVPR
jgi:tetratricopeptide (TPR) repeat protein